MISDFKQIEELFKEINEKLTKKVEVYIIGGAALLFERLKPATKDIDLIIKDEKEFDIFSKTLISINFKEEKPSVVYNKMVDTIMIREDYRIDVFLNKVCKKFSLSTNMIKRSNEILNLKNISIKKCSNEDIFLFKSMTDRPGDLDDCIELVKKELNWIEIKNEIIYQIKVNGEDVWITYIAQTLDELINKGLTIPIIKEIDKMRNDYFNKLEKEQLSKNI